MGLDYISVGNHLTVQAVADGSNMICSSFNSVDGQMIIHVRAFCGHMCWLRNNYGKKWWPQRKDSKLCAIYITPDCVWSYEHWTVHRIGISTKILFLFWCCVIRRTWPLRQWNDWERSSQTADNVRTSEQPPRQWTVDRRSAEWGTRQHRFNRRYVPASGRSRQGVRNHSTGSDPGARRRLAGAAAQCNVYRCPVSLVDNSQESIEAKLIEITKTYVYCCHFVMNF